MNVSFKSKFTYVKINAKKVCNLSLPERRVVGFDLDWFVVGKLRFVCGGLIFGRFV